MSPEHMYTFPEVHMCVRDIYSKNQLINVQVVNMYINFLLSKGRSDGGANLTSLSPVHIRWGVSRRKIMPNPIRVSTQDRWDDGGGGRTENHQIQI